MRRVYGARMRRTYWLGACAACLFALPTQANAEEPAGGCPGPPGDGVTNTQPGPIRQAETFTSSFTGTLTRAEVAITKSVGSSGDYLLQVNGVDPTGTPTNDVLATATVDNATVPDGPSTLAAVFPPGSALEGGVAYAFVISRPAASLYTLRMRTGNPCPSNGFFSSPSPADPFTPNPPDRDMVFTVFGEPADLSAPDVQITGAPKAKTKKKQATFEFTGTDARAVAGFECSLDGGAFAACTSPHTIKVKKGKHTFAVRATDQAGNVDATPATFAWKVKKKKRR